MTPEEKQRILSAFAGLSSYYSQRQLPDVVLGMYLQDVSDLPCQAVLDALKVLRRDPKRRSMPLPADVRAMVAPEQETPDACANKMAGDIVAAVSRFGYVRPTQARAYLGEVAWAVVVAKGGWVNICCNLNVNDTSFFAQCRELSRAYLATHSVNNKLSVLPEKAAQKALDGCQTSNQEGIAAARGILQQIMGGEAK